MFELQEATPTNGKVNSVNSGGDKKTASEADSEATASSNDQQKSVRKPILVTEKVELERRVPITTPRPTTPSTTTRTTTTSTASTTSEPSRRGGGRPVNKSQKVLQSVSKATTTLAVARQDVDEGTINNLYDTRRMLRYTPRFHGKNLKKNRKKNFTQKKNSRIFFQKIFREFFFLFFLAIARCSTANLGYALPAKNWGV
jgi:hypothetical protein